jgi:hypothetical protein
MNGPLDQNKNPKRAAGDRALLIDFEHNFFVTTFEITDVGNTNDFCSEEFNLKNLFGNSTETYFFGAPFNPQNFVAAKYV